jgi:hypothetical protein
VAYAVLRAPLDVCVARAGARDSQPLADPNVVERLWQDFANLGPLARHAVDVGTEDAQAAADLLGARLRDGEPRGLTLPLVEGLRWRSWKATPTASASSPG